MPKVNVIIAPGWVARSPAASATSAVVALRTSPKSRPGRAVAVAPGGPILRAQARPQQFRNEVR